MRQSISVLLAKVDANPVREMCKLAIFLISAHRDLTDIYRECFRSDSEVAHRARRAHRDPAATREGFHHIHHTLRLAAVSWPATRRRAVSPPPGTSLLCVWNLSPPLRPRSPGDSGKKDGNAYVRSAPSAVCANGWEIVCLKIPE